VDFKIFAHLMKKHPMLRRAIAFKF